MKIGFLIPYFYPVVGGAENNIYNLAVRLAKKNEVHVFTKDRKDGEVFKKEERYKGMIIHRFKPLDSGYYLSLYPKLMKEIRKYKFDILHVVGFGFIQQDLALLTHRRNGGIIVNTPHGPFMTLENYPIHLRALRAAYIGFLKIAYKRYDGVFEINPRQNGWIRDYGVTNDKIFFLPPGIDKDAFKPISASCLKETESKYKLKNRFVVSYLGRIQKYKGLDQVIKALPEIKKIRRDILFVAMGADAGDRNRLEEMANKLSVADNVLFTGKISEKEKMALLEMSEIFIFPSEWEAFGIATLEAMARGNAVISTKTEGSVYLIKNGINGELFEYRDIKALTKSLSLLIRNERLRGKMQRENVKKAKEFIWEDIVNSLEKKYGELLKKSY